MARRRRYLLWGGTMILVMTLATLIAPLTTQGATRFANTAFEAQWQSLERAIPNFYGPLSTAFDPTTEPYVEGIANGQSGVRLVQYFDKARLEQITPDRRITSGLLTVELKSGNLQLGNSTFAQYLPAYIGIAGDPGGGGPTYADLGQLPERVQQASGSVNLRFDAASGTFANITPSSDPQTAFAQYIADPNGRFGQNVPRAFSEFLRRIPGGSLTAMGYPIGPAFVANVRLKGVNNVAVIVQPFQRRVLTYTPTNQASTRVEFGNIGRHYLQWRSSLGTTPTIGAGTPFPTFLPGLPTPVFVTNTPGATATDTPGAATNTPGATATNTRSPEDGTATAVSDIATAGAVTATAAQNFLTVTAVAAAATGTSLTATAGAADATTVTRAGTQTAVAAAATGTSLTATAVIVDGTAAANNANATAANNATAAAATAIAAAATATQVSLEATGAAIIFATQTAEAGQTATVAAGQTATATILGTPGAVTGAGQRQAFVPRRTPAASART